MKEAKALSLSLPCPPPPPTRSSPVLRLVLACVCIHWARSLETAKPEHQTDKMLVQTGVFLAGLLAATASAQSIGKEQTETHPKMTWKKCSGSGGSCTTVNGEVTIDSNWRWLHGTSDTKNCYDGNKWTDKCSSASDCATKCAVEGATYAKTYGATTSGDALTLKFVTKNDYGTNIGSRFYLLNGASKYQMFTLLGNEFTFDVDLSTVDCGLNAALYFVAMEEDGGMKSYSSNKAGAKYGTGYCDAQCARDLKFVGGKASFSPPPFRLCTSR